MGKAFLTLIIVLLAAASARAEAPASKLTLSFGDHSERFTAAQLLARPDAARITIPDDVSYRSKMVYRAVTLLSLIGEEAAHAFDTLEVRAADGFASQIPLPSVEKGAQDGSVAWLAVEDPSAPWPPLPGKDVSAGPFYLVWEHPERSGIGSELWPYQTVSITGVRAPARRWPQMAVDEALPADAPARRGQAVFTMQCMPCHRIKGAGAADVGPDLGAPMNPTRYMSPEGLRALIRDPKSVRTWPGQLMPAFDETKLSDADLDAIIAYLTHMAER
ncbi:MAG TPA: cytochrome c [Hyphomicrobium sp.]|nr:cytochrome c [Hyphomicrobium sp.]